MLGGVAVVLNEEVSHEKEVGHRTEPESRNDELISIHGRTARVRMLGSLLKLTRRGLRL